MSDKKRVQGALQLAKRQRFLEDIGGIERVDFAFDVGQIGLLGDLRLGTGRHSGHI